MMRKEKIFKAFGTVNSIIIYEDNQAILDMMASYVNELDDKWSLFKSDSLVCQINAQAGIGWVKVDDDTLSLLKLAKRCSKESEGAFSITSWPLNQLWKKAIKNGQMPDAKLVLKRKALVNDDDLLIDEVTRTVSLRKTGQGIDLGGIAKGYALDKAREMLVDAGISDAIINFGGSVSLIGKKRRIGIQNPNKLTGVPVGSLDLIDESVVTSGDYERNVNANGHFIHHIVDPNSGYPSVSGIKSLTLIGSNAAILDAFSTACFVQGCDLAVGFIQKLKLDAIIINEKMDVLCTPGIRGNFALGAN